MPNFHNLFKFIEKKRPEYKTPLAARIRLEPKFDPFTYVVDKGVDLTSDEISTLIRGVKGQSDKDKITVQILKSKGESLTNDDLVDIINEASERNGIIKTVERFSQLLPEKTESAIESDSTLNVLFKQKARMTPEELETMMMHNNMGDELRVAIIQIRKNTLSDKEFKILFKNADSFMKVALAIVDVMGNALSKGDFTGVKSIFYFGMHNPNQLDLVIKRMLRYTNSNDLSNYLSDERMDRSALKVRSYDYI